MRVLVATNQVPFVRGGAEHHAEGLRDALRAAGHVSEVVAIPFKWYPAERIIDQMLACRLLDVTESDGYPVDRLICLKFPAYLIPHSSKVTWLLHQHRSAYDLWEHELGGDLSADPKGLQVRDAIRNADSTLLLESKLIFANSENVARRLREYCQIESSPLYHPPPNAESFYSGNEEDYLFFPSRLSPIKRQHLVLEALAHTRYPVRVCFAHSADHSTYTSELRNMIDDYELAGRAAFVGDVSEEEKRELYARALAVIYPPVDEDYGYVTLEAMLASKLVLTCTDSGGPLEFVRDQQTGVVVEPTPAAMASALDQLWEDRPRARVMGQAGRDLYDTLGISWPKVIERLLA